MKKDIVIYTGLNGKQHKASILDSFGDRVNIELLDEGEIFLNVPKRMLRTLNEKKK